MKDIFHFKQTGMTPQGDIIGEWVMNKEQPTCIDKFKKRMVELPEGFFNS